MDECASCEGEYRHGSVHGLLVVAGCDPAGVKIITTIKLCRPCRNPVAVLDYCMERPITVRLLNAVL